MEKAILKDYRIIQPHQASYNNPLIGREGDKLIPQKRNPQWPGWVWCDHASGKSGWVPESWLHFENGHSILQRDYDATERTVNPGDAFEVVCIESGWAWGTTANRQEGWIPAYCLEETTDHQ